MSDQPSGAAHPLRSRLGGRNLYLVGMMGSGKSSSGRPLAQQLGYGFVDADNVIEEVAGRSIPDLFEQEGEEGFRALESQVLQAIGQRHSLVVATGGGVVTRPQNWGVLHQGIVIWLDPPRETLMRRLTDDSTPRPLLACPDPEEALQRLLEQRRPLYAEADLRVPIGDQTAETVASLVLEKIPTILRTDPGAPDAPRTTGG